jgi:hypothetical protein
MNFFVQNGHAMRRLANFWGTAVLLQQDGKRNFHSGGTEMIRKTLITLTALAALGIGSTAMAGHGGGGHGGGGHGGGGGWGGGAGMHSGGGGWGGGPGLSGARPGGMAPMTMRGANAMPMTRGMTTAAVRGPVQSWNGPRNHLAWGMRDHHFHDHFHHRFHNRFFAFGFGGYGYDSCWAYNGWQWVYVCGDYGYY